MRVAAHVAGGLGEPVTPIRLDVVGDDVITGRGGSESSHRTSDQGGGVLRPERFDVRRLDQVFQPPAHPFPCSEPRIGPPAEHGRSHPPATRHIRVISYGWRSAWLAMPSHGGPSDGGPGGGLPAEVTVTGRDSHFGVDPHPLRKPRPVAARGGGPVHDGLDDPDSLTRVSVEHRQWAADQLEPRAADQAVGPVVPNWPDRAAPGPGPGRHG